MEAVILDIRMRRHSGIGTYLRGLCEGMARLPEAPPFVFYGPLKFRPLVPERLCERFVVRDHPVYSVKEQIGFPDSLRHRPLFHAPHYNIPLRFRGRLVATIHDLNHLVFPRNLPSPLHRIYAKYMFGECAARASRIITDSESMRRDVIERLGVPAERVTAIPLAVSASFKPPGDPEEIKRFRRENHLPGDYLLAVGINKPHKNYAFLLKALAPLWKQKEAVLPLVIAGPRKSDSASLREAARSLGVEDRVILKGRFSREDMAKLYAGAACLVFPSLYEGFGLPPLEAMKCATPVLASRRAPMTEVCGEAAVYFDPEDPGELQAALLKILGDSRLARDLIEKGRENIKRFDWKKCAAATVDVYRRALEEDAKF